MALKLDFSTYVSTIRQVHHHHLIYRQEANEPQHASPLPSAHVKQQSSLRAVNVEENLPKNTLSKSGVTKPPSTALKLRAYAGTELLNVNLSRLLSYRFLVIERDDV
jgi:hypothetical protein